MWVVLHVNLTFALSFVPDLHVQCGSVCRKFAYSAYLRKRSTLVKVYFIYQFLSFHTYTFRSLATKEVCWKVSLNKWKNNADKKERRFGVILTSFSSSKCLLINCQDDAQSSFFLVRVVFSCFCITKPFLIKVSLIRKSHWFYSLPRRRS